MTGLTLAGAEGEHGRLPLPRRAPRHHQHLVQAGRLQFGQSQRFLAARHTDGLPAPHHGSHFINLTCREEGGRGEGGGVNGREKSATHGEQNTGFQQAGQTASFQSDPPYFYFFFNDCVRARTKPGTQSGTIPSRFHSQFPTLAAAAAAAAASRVLTRVASLLQSVRAYY